MEPLWIVLIVGIVIAALAGSAYFKHQRAQGLKRFADRHRFIYYPHAAPGLLAYGFPLFLKGDGRGARNGLTGTWKDMPFKGGDFWFYEEQPRNHDQTAGGTIYHHFSVAATGIPAWLPDITISRENLFSTVARRFGADDIDFESEEFNRAFRVKTNDRRFAFDLIDARMMQWLLNCDPRFGFETNRRGLLVYSKRLDPKDMLTLIGTLKEFHDRIPRVVLRNYDIDGGLGAG